jgi:hypothetical protein
MRVKIKLCVRDANSLPVIHNALRTETGLDLRESGRCVEFDGNIDVIKFNVVRDLIRRDKTYVFSMIEMYPYNIREDIQKLASIRQRPPSPLSTLARVKTKKITYSTLESINLPSNFNPYWHLELKTIE